MRRVFIAGGCLEVSDAVADALWDHQLAVLSAGAMATVELPTVVDGVVGSCRVLLTPQAPVTIVEIPRSPAGALAGDAEAIETMNLQRLTLLR